MSQDELNRFRAQVLREQTLQEQLRQTPDLQQFLTLMLSLGTAYGYDFTAEEVQEALRASRRAWLERGL